MRTNTNTQTRFAKLISSFALAAPLLAGCGSPVVNPSVALVDRTVKPLSLGDFLEVNGTYGADCIDRSGSWSVGIGGFSGLTNPALSVIKNDSGCKLWASSVRVGSLGGSVLYAPAANLALAADYAAQAHPFAPSQSAPTAFYGNLRVQPDLSFGSDFTVDLVYSEDPRWASAGVVANYGVQSAGLQTGGVSAPDYSIDLTSFVMQVDANKIVQSTSGGGVLMAMNTLCQTFIVSANDLGAAPSFAAVDAEFQTLPAQTLAPSNPEIAADSFFLTGANLAMPQIRTLILANTVAGTTSYEVFRITFSAP